VHGHDRLRLSPHVESVRAGRHFVQQTLARWHLEDLVDVATLLTSEAVTNAVIHAATPVLLDVYTREQLVIEVSDHDTTAVLPPVAAAGLESLLEEPDLDAENGRGLMLIATLADRWGIVPSPEGKTVWFALDLTPGSDGTGFSD
jgi:anti-sigma regulatory factor (Ser/Thr protein kinase)